jgi:hypothetical protein
MSRDELAAAVLIGSLAAWGVLHVQIALRLLFARPRWRGLVALVFPPIAPYWAARSGDRARAVAWTASLLIWGTARVFLAR